MGGPIHHSDIGQYDMAAAAFAGECREHLQDRLDDHAPISVTTLVHDDGDFSAQAFHTIWNDPERDDFAREVIKYSSYTSDDERFRDVFIHAVEYYFDGHHEKWNFYELDRFDE